MRYAKFTVARHALDLHWLRVLGEQGQLERDDVIAIGVIDFEKHDNDMGRSQYACLSRNELNCVPARAKKVERASLRIGGTPVGQENGNLHRTLVSESVGLCASTETHSPTW